MRTERRLPCSQVAPLLSHERLGRPAGCQFQQSRSCSEVGVERQHCKETAIPALAVGS